MTTEAIEAETTSSAARRQWSLYREAWTDRLIGAGLVHTLRLHSDLDRVPLASLAVSARETGDGAASLKAVKSFPQPPSLPTAPSVTFSAVRPKSFFHSLAPSTPYSSLSNYMSPNNSTDSEDHTLPTANRTQMYVFAYASPSDSWTRLLGVYSGAELVYFFGLPRLAEYKTPEELILEWPRDLGLEPPSSAVEAPPQMSSTNSSRQAPESRSSPSGHRSIYSEMDIKMTDLMLSLIVNFARSGNATPQVIYNVTWDTYRPDNRTYLWLNLTQVIPSQPIRQPACRFLQTKNLTHELRMFQNYRTYRLAFWSQLYPRLLARWPMFTTLGPTPAYLETYRQASFSMASALGICLLVLVALLWVYTRRLKMLVK